MKKQVLVIFSFLLCSVLHAQFTTIAETSVFKEAEDGLAKLMQLKNGNTFFMLIDDKKEIELHIYDAAHKEKVSTTVKPDIGKAKRATINDIFEMNGDVVIFIMSVDDREPSLIRIIMDGNTGTIKKQEELFNIGRVSLGKAYGMALANLEEPGFDVIKDPTYDVYTVVIFNTLESDRNKRIQLVMYGSDHKELSRAYVKSPGEKYKYMTYGSVMMRDGKLIMLARGYNTKASGDPNETAVLLTTLNKGDTTVTQKQLQFAKNVNLGRTLMNYNPITKDIMVIGVERENKSGYTAYLYFLDPETGKVKKSQDLFPKEVYATSAELFGNKNAFSGMPVMFSAYDDGSFSVVFEEQTTITRSGSNYVSTSYQYGNLAVSLFDKDGKETSSYLIPKDHYNNNFYGGSEGGATILKAGNQYKEFLYITMNGKPYVFMNDLQENEERIQKGKVSRVIGVGECDAYTFELQGKDVVLHRKYFFGEPEKGHTLCLFSECDYNKEKNILATIKLQLGGKNKGMSLVWMQPK
ncbi:hypothetical protein FRZ67_22795 [Panacibacter ginsenosidivorans]|uniref:Uncharacterized protein n=1 Tax=Panacibacter ginsenosidivorans TaxID=1813871 RepID=A0A5B8VEL7_9BACT|nr:hypothetical protein [Panacibacter ginsenosidivorans]QEC69987.1 hypothetical protein FRZ67_22795 [Panacibacter ginsenosidivorans]